MVESPKDRSFLGEDRLMIPVVWMTTNMGMDFARALKNRESRERQGGAKVVV